MGGTALPTDHNLLIADIMLKLKAQRTKPQQRKIDVSRLVVPGVQQDFCDELAHKSNAIPPTESSQSRNDQFTKLCMMLELSQRATSADVLQNSHDQLPLSKCLNISVQQRLLLSVSVSVHVSRRHLRKDENSYWVGVANELDTAFENGDAVTLYQTVKRLCSKVFYHFRNPGRRPQQILSRTPKQCQEIFRKHFDSLLNKAPPTTIDEELVELDEAAVPRNLTADGPSTLEEVMVAIKGLRN